MQVAPSDREVLTTLSASMRLLLEEAHLLAAALAGNLYRIFSAVGEDK